MPSNPSEDAVTESSKAGEIPDAGTSKAPLQKLVLLIEDSEDAKFLVQHAIHLHGNGKYRLEWASSLSIGLEMLSKYKVDIVLLDLGLPEMEGSATYAAVREVAPTVPVVVVSANTAEETQVSVILGGIYDYLGKEQLSGGLLLEAIRSALSDAQRRSRDLSSVPR
jgi:two-component system KDP operon response regulator KdpE